MAFLEDEPVEEPQLRAAIRAATLDNTITPVLLRLRLQEQGRAAAAGRGHRLPALAAGRASRWSPPIPQTARRHPQGRPQRAVLGAGLQGHVRPVRRQAHLLPRLLRQARLGLIPAERLHRPQGARRPAARDARQPPRGRRADRRRRDRRRRRPQADHHRRHAVRSQPSGAAGVDRLPRSGDRRGRRAQDQGRPGQADHRAPAPRRGGSHLPRAHQRGDRPDDHRRHGRAAPRDHRRSADARVQGRRQRRPAPGCLSRDDPKRRHRHPRQVRAPDRRSRPVRPRGHQPGAERAGRRVRVRKQDRRRRHPPRVHQLGRRRHPRGDERRCALGLPGGRRQGAAGGRLIPRCRLLGDGLQDRRLDGVQRGRQARQAGAAGADHGGRGGHARGLHGRRHRQHQLAPRTDRRHGAARQRTGDPRPCAAG